MGDTASTLIAGDPILFVEVAHDGCVPFRGPRAGYVGDKQEARFIKEDQMGPTSPSIFLYAANGRASSGRSPRHPVAALGGRVSGNSTLNGSAVSRHGRDGKPHPTGAGSAGRRAVRSRDRSDSRRPEDPSGAPWPDASSVLERAWACDRAWIGDAVPSALFLVRLYQRNTELTDALTARPTADRFLPARSSRMACRRRRSSCWAVP